MNCFSVPKQEIHEPYPNASNTWPRRQKVTPTEYHQYHQAALVPETNNYCHRNPWGSLSYADLITQAIDSSPNKRLTLGEIYLWMTTHIPYFRDRAEGPLSLGWKNSIRHNLSLHNKFVKIQNDEKGKSSWWMINTDPMVAKYTRRRSGSASSTSSGKKKGALRRTMDCLKKLIPGKKSESKIHPPINDSAFVVNPVDSHFRPRSYSNVVCPLDTIRETPRLQQTYNCSQHSLEQQQQYTFNGNLNPTQPPQFQVNIQSVNYYQQQYNAYQTDVTHTPSVPVTPASTSDDLAGTFEASGEVDINAIIRLELELEGTLNFT